MGTWIRSQSGEDDGYEWVEPEVPKADLTVTENPVVAELLGPKGEVIRQVRERPPFGYRRG